MIVLKLKGNYDLLCNSCKGSEKTQTDVGMLKCFPTLDMQ